MELNDEIKEQLIEQELYEIFGLDEEGNDISCIIRTPSFEEFEFAFSESFEFTDKNFDVGNFSQILLPKLFVSGDRKVVDDEENLYYASEAINDTLMKVHFLDVVQGFETVEGTKYITYQYEEHKAYVTQPNFKDIRFLKSEMLKRNKLIPISKMIFINNLNKELSSHEYITNPKLLLVCALATQQHVKSKEFTIKKK